MSQTYYNNNYANETVAGLSFEDQMKAYERGKAKSAWYNPATSQIKVDGQVLRPQTIYIGESNQRPTWSEPVLDMKQYELANKLYLEGKIDDDRLKHSPWIGTEWQERVKSYLSAIKDPYKSAAVVTSDDFTALNVINVLAEVIGTEQRTYVLEQAVTRQNTPSLTMSVDAWTGFNASADVDEGVEAFTKKGSMTRTEYGLKKDVGHVAFTDESLMRADRDIQRQHIDHVVYDMKRIKAQKIATELESATDVSTADWGALTGAVSTTNPLDAIGTVQDLIDSNGGRADTAASARRVFRDFAGNTFVKGPQAPFPNVDGGNGVIANAGGTGLTWYIDNLKTNTLVTIYDKRAIILMQGPVRSAQYRLEAKGIDAYITRDYNAVKLVRPELARDLVSASA